MTEKMAGVVYQIYPWKNKSKVLPTKMAVVMCLGLLKKEWSLHLAVVHFHA